MAEVCDGGRIRHRGLTPGLLPWADLQPFLGANLAADVEVETVLGRPGTEGAAEAADAAGCDVFPLRRGGDHRLLAIHDRRRMLTPRPQVFLECRDQGRRFRLYLGSDDPYHRKLGRWFLLGLLAAWGLLRFAHASVVARQGRAVLIFGPHGAGKSTLAAAALVAGCSLLAEGVALFADDGRVVPFFMDGRPVLRLTETAWRELRALLPAGPAAPGVYPSNDPAVPPKRVIPVTELFPGPAPRPARPERVWLPRAGGPPGVVAEAVSRRQARQRAAGHLEDRRVTALRQALGPQPVLRDPEGLHRRAWRATFPARAVALGGTASVAQLASLLAHRDLLP